MKLVNRAQKNGNCSEGGSAFGPQKGYWGNNLDRSDSAFKSKRMPKESWTDTMFHKCIIDESCLGYNATSSNYSVCAKGYTGPLCHSCDFKSNYSRVSGDKCKPCPSGPVGGLIFAAGILLITGIFAIVLVLMRRSAGKQKSLLSSLIKIMVSHMQIVGLLRTIPIDWSVDLPEVAIFLDIWSTFSSLSESIVSIDCFIPSDFSPFERFQIQNVFFLSLPLLLILFVLVARAAISQLNILNNFRKKKRSLSKAASMDTMFSTSDQTEIQKMRATMRISLVVFMLLLHPFLTRQSATIFTCYRLTDDHRYLRFDMRIDCKKEKRYEIYKYTVGIFSFLLYPLGIIAVTYWLLKKNKDRMHTRKTMSSYGFLYLGYKKDVMHFWECVIMIRKVAFVMILVLLNKGTATVIFQTSCGVLVIAMALYLHITYKPYEKPLLNKLEELSLSLLLTTLTAATMVQESIGLGTRKMLSVGIIIPNVVFLCVWLYYVLKESKRLLQGFEQVLLTRMMKKFQKSFHSHSRQHVKMNECKLLLGEVDAIDWHIQKTESFDSGCLNVYVKEEIGGMRQKHCRTKLQAWKTCAFVAAGVEELYDNLYHCSDVRDEISESTILQIEQIDHETGGLTPRVFRRSFPKCNVQNHTIKAMDSIYVAGFDLVSSKFAVVAMKSDAKYGEKFPKPKQVARIHIFLGGWVLEEISEKCTLVSYMENVEYKVKLPEEFFPALARQSVVEAMKALLQKYGQGNPKVIEIMRQRQESTIDDRIASMHDLHEDTIMSMVTGNYFVNPLMSKKKSHKPINLQSKSKSIRQIFGGKGSDNAVRFFFNPLVKNPNPSADSAAQNNVEMTKQKQADRGSGLNISMSEFAARKRKAAREKKYGLGSAWVTTYNEKDDAYIYVNEATGEKREAPPEGAQLVWHDADGTKKYLNDTRDAWVSLRSSLDSKKSVSASL